MPSPRGPPSRALFRALFDQELTYVWNTLRRLGVAERDREDLAHEVFFRVHERLAAYDPTRPARPWLCAFAVRVAAEHRRRAQERYEQLGGADDVAGLAMAPAGAAETKDLVDRALDAIDLDKRAVLLLHDVDGESVPDIARGLGIPEGTVYSRLRAARAELTAAVRRLEARDR
jgi:RNA polymerase sigma-70 factor (ECF subfamily)